MLHKMKIFGASRFIDDQLLHFIKRVDALFTKSTIAQLSLDLKYFHDANARRIIPAPSTITV